ARIAGTVAGEHAAGATGRSSQRLADPDRRGVAGDRRRGPLARAGGRARRDRGPAPAAAGGSEPGAEQPPQRAGVGPARDGDSGGREMEMRVSSEGRRVAVRFRDSGPGVREPESLFQPFQRGAAGTGMGLYVSRVLMRSYGGDLSYEPQPAGSCFVVELEAV